MMRRLQLFFIAVVIVIGFAAPSAMAQIFAGYTSHNVSGPIGFRIVKVDFRKDQTRVYGQLIGKPHTAARIDAMTLTVAPGKSYAWTDIDGVDANRYFQWEDEGVIDVEIDFPPMPHAASFTLKADGPVGQSLWSIKSSKPRKQEKKK